MNQNIKRLYRTEKLADEAITGEKIKTAAIIGDKLRAGSVSETKLTSALHNRILDLENKAFTSIDYWRSSALNITSISKTGSVWTG